MLFYPIFAIISATVDLQAQIQQIEKEIRETPYHKGTEHHIGRLRARLSKLKDKQFESSAKGGGGGGGYSVKKQGDATVVLVGPPSVGKSTLLNKFTNAKSKIAPYDFTTVSVIPGMMVYKNARIQILDVPGLIEGAEKGKGRGREVLSVARGADLLILLCDVENKSMFAKIANSLEKTGIRINKIPPEVAVEKKLKGGIIIHSNIKQDLSKETIKEVAAELGLKNAEINIKEKLTIDKLIDSFSKSRVYVPAITVLNKIDLIDDEGLHNLNHAISAEKGVGLEELKKIIWEKLEFVNVFLVRPSDVPDFNHPIVMKKGQTLTSVAEKIGSDFAQDKKKAKIWGTGAKFAGQEVSLSTKVAEGMQVRFI